MRQRKRGSSRTTEEGAANIRRPLPTWLLHDRTFCHILNRQVEDWLEHRSLGGTGLLEFSNLAYRTGFDFLKGNLIAKPPGLARPVAGRPTKKGSDLPNLPQTTYQTYLEEGESMLTLDASLSGKEPIWARWMQQCPMITSMTLKRDDPP